MTASTASAELPSVLAGMQAIPLGGLDIPVRALLSVAVVTALWTFRWLLMRQVERRAFPARTRYQWRKGTSYAASVVGLLILALIWWAPGMRSVGTFLGLVAAALAFALRDVVANLTGWLVILWRRSFEVGDRIEVDGRQGDVIDTRILEFSMLEVGNWVHADQSTGRVIDVPNSIVFRQPVANFTREFPFIWNEIPVRITFESDWKRAKAILAEIIEGETGRFSKKAEAVLARGASRGFIHFRTLTPIVYTSADEHGIILTARHLCNPRKRRGTAERIWERILDELGSDTGVQFAYPTYRIVDRVMAEKPDAVGNRPDILEARNNLNETR